MLNKQSYSTAGNRHKQNSWFCKEIREDNLRFWWRRVHEDASQGMYMSKIEIFFFTARIMMKIYWKFNLYLCQEQLRNVRVSQFSSCFSWDDWFCESYWCPSSCRVFKSIKVIFHCSWAVHLERNISFKESIHNCNCGFPWFNLSLLIICCLWQLKRFTSCNHF
jgi:hypothetical protein